MPTVRPPAVAGAFYPGNPIELRKAVDHYIAEAETAPGPVPKAIIAPHAGYVYSGPVAASAYVRIKPAHDVIKRVVLLGPTHRVGVRGMALSSADVFRTPLEDIPIDKEAEALIRNLPQVKTFDPSHAQEHSLEVHLPFLQRVIDDFALLPLAVGDSNADEVAQVLQALWGGPETLIVISTDLSHFLDYDTAMKVDGRTKSAIESFDAAAIGREQACGRIPMSGMLALAKRLDMTIQPVDFRNSGDTAGDKSRVVGYGSWLLFEKGQERGGRKITISVKKDPEAEFEAATKALLQKHGPDLLKLAASSLVYGLDHGKPLPVRLDDFPPELRAKGACFMTLEKGGRLRGCIGSPMAYRPLAQDVAEHGFDCAFRDNRFKPVSRGELADLELSISVLSPSFPMKFEDEADLLRQLRVGIDGLIIEDGGRRALFLPSVWEQLPDKVQFLGHLKAKAGMKPNHWSSSFKAQRFIAEKLAAKDLEDPGSIWPGRS